MEIKGPIPKKKIAKENKFLNFGGFSLISKDFSSKYDYLCLK